jgi:DNA-binding CsgD family transcriptional regulator
MPRKLTADKIKNIVALVAEGVPVREVAERLGIHKLTVRRHRNRILGSPELGPPFYPKNGNAERARAMLLQRVSCCEVARRLGITHQTAYFYWLPLRRRLIDQGTNFRCLGCKKPLHNGSCVPKARKRGDAVASGHRSTIADPLYVEISRYVPARLADDIRDEIMSAAYMAVLEGEMCIDTLGAKMGTIINRALKHELGAFSGGLIESADDFDILARVEDPRALEAFDEIEW